MIEKIRLDDNQETYYIDLQGNDVAVILCIQGTIEIKNYNNQSQVYAKLNPYESWTLTTSYLAAIVKAVDPTGAEFLIIRYFRS